MAISIQHPQRPQVPSSQVSIVVPPTNITYYYCYVSTKHFKTTLDFLQELYLRATCKILCSLESGVMVLDLGDGIPESVATSLLTKHEHLPIGMTGFGGRWSYSPRNLYEYSFSTGSDREFREEVVAHQSKTYTN